MEEIFEHKAKFCPNIDCPERIMKLEYEHLYKKQKEDRDNLYEQLQKIRNTLNRKEIKENKEDVEWLTHQNLNLTNDREELKQNLESKENELLESLKELKELRKYKQEQEEFAKKQIDEYASIPDKYKHLAKEIQEQQLQKARNEEELLRQNSILSIGKKEIEKKLKELEELQGKIKQEKEQKEIGKKNLRKINKINMLLAKAIKYKDMFRIDKVKQMQVKIKKEFEKLNEEQKKLILSKYDELMKI